MTPVAQTQRLVFSSTRLCVILCSHSHFSIIHTQRNPYTSFIISFICTISSHTLKNMLLQKTEYALQKKMPSVELQPIVMAAGRGSRLTEITGDRPKCLLPVGPFPLVYYTLHQLEKHGFTGKIQRIDECFDSIASYYFNLPDIDSMHPRILFNVATTIYKHTHTTEISRTTSNRYDYRCAGRAQVRGSSGPGTLSAAHQARLCHHTNGL